MDAPTGWRDGGLGACILDVACARFSIVSIKVDIDLIPTISMKSAL